MGSSQPMSVQRIGSNLTAPVKITTANRVVATADGQAGRAIERHGYRVCTVDDN